MTELKNNSKWLLKPLRLDCPDGAITEVFRCAPEDAYGRGIALTVTDGGSPMSLSGCSVYLAWSDSKGSCGTREFAPVDAANGYFEVDFPPGMARNAPCEVRACITISMPGGKVTSSREFPIHVRQAVITDDMMAADDSYSAFAQGLVDLQAFDSEIRQAETARASAEASRASAETARASAESARASAETARAAAETARQESFAEWLETRDEVVLNYVDDETATAAVGAMF